jgi:hypothetical protein
MSHAIRYVVSCALASLLLTGCDKSDTKTESKTADKEESAKGGASKSKKGDKSGKADEEKDGTALKVKANFEEFDGTYDAAIAEWSGVGFSVWFTRGCKELACNNSGYLDSDEIKKACPKAFLAIVKVEDKPNVVPPAGSYDAEISLRDLGEGSNSHIPGDSKKKLTLTASSKTEVSGKVEILDEDGDFAKGSFTAKVCPHNED